MPPRFALTDVLFAEETQTAEVRLGSVLEGGIQNLRASYSEAVVHVEGPLSNAVILADELLDSVFRNLLKNAVQHNDKEVPEITVSTEDRDEEVVVRIEDNGPGVSTGQTETIFATGEKDLESGGTGIGLYLVRTLVEKYGGDVWVEDADPTGAAFVVVLPTVSAGQETAVGVA